MRSFTIYPKRYIKSSTDMGYDAFSEKCMDGVLDEIEQRYHTVDVDFDVATHDIIFTCDDGTLVYLFADLYSEALESAFVVYGMDYAKCVEAVVDSVVHWDPYSDEDIDDDIDWGDDYE